MYQTQMDIIRNRLKLHRLGLLFLIDDSTKIAKGK